DDPGGAGQVANGVLLLIQGNALRRNVQVTGRHVPILDSDRSSASPSPAVYQCHLSRTNLTFARSIAAISSFISTIVWMNGCRDDVQEVFGPTYSRPRRRPRSSRMPAISR